MKIKSNFLIPIVIVVLILAAAIGLFAYRNLSYDYINEHFLEKKGYKLGFTDNTIKLEDGSELYYIEGPENGPSLLLLHGQQVTCFDYAKVLPKLSKEFHVFALDYYGHGKSSKNPDKYSAVKIGDDIIWFIKNIIQDSTYISGHSSGALLAAYISAKAPEHIIAAVFEDAPFFSTLPGRAENTIAWLSFKNMYDYLNHHQTTTFVEYNLEHDYAEEIFNSYEPQLWNQLVRYPALRYIRKHPGAIPKIWYYPPKSGLNSLYALNANIQDGTGQYDLRFGVTFYDFSWFEGFDTEEILKNIQVPTIVMQVGAGEIAPDYYDQNGILLAAMDRKDAERVVILIPNSVYFGGFKSMHDIHADLPDEYVQILVDLKNHSNNNKL